VPAGLPAPEETARAIAAALAAGARRGHGAAASAGLSAPEERAAQTESAAASAHASAFAGSASREAALCGSVGATAASGSRADAAVAVSAGPLECGRRVTPAIRDDSSAVQTVRAGTPDRIPEEALSPDSGTQSSAAASGTSVLETVPAGTFGGDRSSARVSRPANAADGVPAIPAVSGPFPETAPRPRALTVGCLFDPRTFWIGYVLLSAGILLQHSLIGLAVSAAVTLAAVLLSQVPFRAVWKPLRAFLIFTGLSALIAGLTIGAGQGGSPVGFEPQAALSAVRALSNLMLVLILGVLFPLTVGYLRMKQGVEQGLAFLGRLKFPVEAVALTASLMFRFIPLIGGQWNRFGRIAKARGQGRSGKIGIGLTEFRIMALPFMFSLIRMADEFSTALEIRGYSRTGGRRTRSLTLRMNLRDYAAMGVFLLVFLCLAALAGILG